MYQSPNPYATPEPHFPPGYGGHCPTIREHCGRTYGAQTYEILKGFKHYSAYFQNGRHCPSPGPSLGCSNKGHRRSINNSCCRYHAAPYKEELIREPNWDRSVRGPVNDRMFRAPCCEGHHKAVEGIGPPRSADGNKKEKCYTMLVEPVECSPAHVNCPHTRNKSSAYYLHVCDCFQPNSIVKCS